MKLYVDLNLNRIVAAPGVATAAGSPKFKRGDAGLLEVQFCRGTTLTQLAAGGSTTLKFALKELDVFDTDPVVALASFTEPAVTDEVYLGYPDFNTTELDALLVKDGDDSNDVASVNVNLEFTWSVDSGATWLSTETLVARVENDVIRGDEGTPSSQPTPEDWLSARGIRWDAAIVGLTGGGATNLDGIVTVDLAVGRLQAVKDSLFGLWILTAGTDAENGDTVIRPDDYATTTNEKIWQLVSLSVDQIVVYGGGSLFGNPQFIDGFGSSGKATLNDGLIVGNEVEFTPGTLTDAATISWDAAAKGVMAGVTLAGNRTLAKPTGITVGKASTLVLQITQDGTGGRTLAYAGGINFVGGVVPVLSTAAAAVDVLQLVTVDGGTTWSAMLLRSGPSEALTVLADGTVGIGTASPETLLHINAVGGSNPSFRISDGDVGHSFTSVGFNPEVASDTIFNLAPNSGTSGGIQILGFTENATTTGINLFGHLGSASPTGKAVGISGYKSDGGAGRTLLTGSEIALTVQGDAIVVTGEKNVGIGTTSPTAPLDINGDNFRLRTAKTPASAAATGNAGEIAWDASYIYVCTATDTWKRTAISTW